MRRRDWVLGAGASMVVGGAGRLHAQARRRRVEVRVDNLEELGEGARFLDMRIAVDGVLLVPRANAADRTVLLLAEGLREFELFVRMELGGRVRPLGGTYRYAVRAHHDRLVVRIAIPSGDPSTGVASIPDRDPVGCHRTGPSDCSEGYEGTRVLLRLE